MMALPMTSESVFVRSHPRCLKHLPGMGHPETPARLRAVLGALGDLGNGWLSVEPEVELPADDEILSAVAWIHDSALVERFRDAVAAAPSHVDGDDNPVSEGSFGAAVAAAGVSLVTALDLVNDRVRRAFLAVRPPGHHAERGRARGFCFFNNVALAAEVIVQAWGGPVLIVDFDVTHGSGTQQLFYERPEVGLISVHRHPFFPGSGTAEEDGQGPGAGATCNVPLAAGADDDVFATALEDALEQMGRRLRPAAVLISAGFGAHRLDPLGGMAVTEAGFARMTRSIVQAADAWAGGRVLSVLEGGWHLEALASCARAHVAALSGRDPCPL